MKSTIMNTDVFSLVWGGEGDRGGGKNTLSQLQ